ncbi:MAG TPA: DUF308 domain-containing protein [Gammaproteobacteria bacterium]|jgi:uncharacterized membrane protein HdeD (DUF308 family)|nr:DUF308 domain-containing protein [Gammaproteobacteria bacterium]
MAKLPNRNIPLLPTFNQHAGWFIAWGAVLVILGFFAISAALWTTLISVILLGAIIFATGIVVMIDSFIFWRHKLSGFWLHFFMAILYLLAGIMLITNPEISSVSITLILAIFYVCVGISRIVYSLSLRLPQWGWNFFNGIIALLLGILIIAGWPMSGLYIIGLFVGIDLVFLGWAYLMSGFCARCAE